MRVPALVLVVSLIGFGSLCRQSGLSIDFALISTAVMWALPGQIAFVELHSAGNAYLAIVLAVAMANARFFPMTATLMPLLRPGVRRKSWLYVLAHLVSFNSWVWTLRRSPELPVLARAPYYVAFVAVSFVAGMTGVALGYVLAGVAPPSVALGLVFLNVTYFVLMLSDARRLPALLAVIAGAIGGPLLHLVSSDWGLLITGVVGGTLAFLGARIVRAPNG